MEKRNEIMNLLTQALHQKEKEDKQKSFQKDLKEFQETDQRLAGKYFTDGNRFFWVITGYCSNPVYVSTLVFEADEPALDVRRDMGFNYTGLNFHILFEGFYMDTISHSYLEEKMKEISEETFFSKLDSKYEHLKQELRTVKDNIKKWNEEYMQDRYPVKDLDEEMEILQKRIQNKEPITQRELRDKIDLFSKWEEYEELNQRRNNRIFRCQDSFYYPLGNQKYQEYFTFSLSEPILPIPHSLEDSDLVFCYYQANFRFAEAEMLPSSMLDKREMVEVISEDEYFANLDQQYARMKEVLKGYSRDIRKMVEKIGEMIDGEEEVVVPGFELLF